MLGHSFKVVWSVKGTCLPSILYPLLNSESWKITGLNIHPDNWEQFVHPDGKFYFRNLQLENWHAHICKSSLSTETELSNNIELYLALDPEPRHYYVDHSPRQVFWVESFPLNEILPSGQDGRSSVEVFSLQNYYRHLEYFPRHNALPYDSVEFLRDHMTLGDSATAP
ncbi:hypothetical protein BDZ94DRAFT_862831 [Collybia nuda]|uniref:Uncharacterized protein n=1 Tax=Collybia nuda TaxID=64659 RepID=A0A9P5Y264_9AGAR|nr:hypothetical protein BDZ94DRAFT_862831 [Collybia nuda]